MKQSTLWWDKKYGKQSICGITQTRLRPGINKQGKTYTIRLKCKHTFYRSALQKWGNSFQTYVPCPLCRKKFNKYIIL